ncbi:hypothetical protein NDU88_008481 [Pleurodeles waltl]|uniref:Uncharacterized protein n=1 Tax=Pleurodeles waltl TaxID=8319 RepID=A0AAV7N7G4_PLEWA|nr:hypothetical protein NDU88_008481 [Pleurodeles waltl]
MEPELNIIPALVYLLIYHEYEVRRRRQRGAVLERKGPAERCLRRRGPAERCLRRRGPVQRCSSAPRALFSGAYLHGGALFSGTLLHRGPCSAVPISTAGPCSAVLFCTAGPVQRCLSPRRGPVQRCSSAPRALFSGAHPAGQGSQTWPGLPVQSPSDRDVSGPFGDGLLASLVSSFPAGMWHVGSTFSALLLPFRSFDGALGPLPPPDGVGGEVAAHCSLGAALSVLARRSLVLRVLLPGGGLDVSLLQLDVSLLVKGGLQNPGTTVTPEAGLVVAACSWDSLKMDGGGHRGERG